MGLLGLAGPQSFLWATLLAQQLYNAARRIQVQLGWRVTDCFDDRTRSESQRDYVFKKQPAMVFCCSRSRKSTIVVIRATELKACRSDCVTRNCCKMIAFMLPIRRRLDFERYAPPVSEELRGEERDRSVAEEVVQLERFEESCA